MVQTPSRKFTRPRPAGAHLKNRLSNWLTPPAAKPVSDNPYTNARESWNHHIGALMNSNQLWQALALTSMLTAMISIGGVIYIGSQSKYVPYIVEVDKLGQTMAVAPALPNAHVDTRIMQATLANFIVSARTVTPDIALQRKAVFQVYAYLSNNDPAAQRMNQWFNGDAQSSPFNRAAKESVQVEISTVLQQSPESWQVDWQENTYDRQGILKTSQKLRALISPYVAKPDSDITEEQIRKNPLGIYVRDFNWTKQI